MESFETKLHKASSICGGSFNYSSEFSRIYTFTTENISGYINYFDFNNKNLLTVGSSGDQVLNALLSEPEKIDAFDISIFPRYFLELKIAAIKTLTREEYISFFM